MPRGYSDLGSVSSDHTEDTSSCKRQRTTWECLDHASSSLTFPRTSGSSRTAARGRTGPQSTDSTPSTTWYYSKHYDNTASKQQAHTNIVSSENFVFQFLLLLDCFLVLVPCNRLSCLPSVLWRCWLGSRKGIRPVKNWVVGLSLWSKVQTCIWPNWCHCHSLSLAWVKSRLVLPFWYRPTRVVPERGPLNGCVCVLVSTVSTHYYSLSHRIASQAPYRWHGAVAPWLLKRRRPRAEDAVQTPLAGNSCWWRPMTTMTPTDCNMTQRRTLWGIKKCTPVVFAIT